ncbi:MAG: glycosyltransferase family 4 protein [Herpetosiphonaceae bacterium]|nr:glycosyltransferase family 4 protein [Herpetosiphonaceae bacterium]
MRAAPLRVLMLARAVYPIHGFGGIERHVFHLVTHLMRQGVEVKLVIGRVAGSTPAAQLERIVTAASLKEHQDSYGSLLLTSRRYDHTSPLLRPNSILGRQINYPLFSLAEGRLAASVVKSGMVDVVHSQGLCAWGYACVREREPLVRRVPFIANPHGLEEYRTPDWRKRLAYIPFRALYSWAHRVADRVIATDGCTQDDLPKYLRVDPARVVVIPSAIDVDECLGAVRAETRVELRARFKLGEAEPKLLSVGRLERNKGYHLLLDALAELRPLLGPRWCWLLVGTGKERAALQAQAQQLGLSEHIVFAGALDDTELHSLYEEVDLFVHPTLYEGSSLVTLEAMIHSLPVVASAAGGIPDKVFPQHNGLLVPPGDTPALIRALQEALQQRAAWPSWGLHGKMIAETTFSWPAVARRTKAEYEWMLDAAASNHAVN